MPGSSAGNDAVLRHAAMREQALTAPARLFAGLRFDGNCNRLVVDHFHLIAFFDPLELLGVLHDQVRELPCGPFNVTTPV